MKIPMAYDSFLLEHANQRKYIEWDTDMHPHLAILANSGAGKSYFIRLLAGNIYITAREKGEKPKGYILCFKNELVKTPAPRFWGYKNVITGFEQFYSEFEKRLAGDPCREFRLLLVDEYISWLSSMGKEAESISKRMATMLFMTRSLNMHIILCCHRGMAVDFSHGSRDCLNIIFLGSPSKESIKSFCSAEDSKKLEPKGRGEGYTIFDAQEPIEITVPTVKDEDKLNEAIMRLISD